MLRLLANFQTAIFDAFEVTHMVKIKVPTRNIRIYVQVFKVKLS